MLKIVMNNLTIIIQQFTNKISFQLFVTIAINTSALSVGVNIASTGIILSRLRESKDDIDLTNDEESWFGK